MKKVKIEYSYVGIDPGKDGGIAVIHPSGDVEKFLIPQITKGVVDYTALNAIIDDICFMSSCKGAMEQVHSIFGSSAKSNFEFGRINGILEGMLVSNKIPYTLIPPKTWQKEMLQGIPDIIKTVVRKGIKKEKKDVKAMSELAVKKLFPTIDLRASNRSKKFHDGLVDAVLLAEYARRNSL